MGRTSADGLPPTALKYKPFRKRIIDRESKIWAPKQANYGLVVYIIMLKIKDTKSQLSIMFITQTSDKDSTTRCTFTNKLPTTFTCEFAHLKTTGDTE